MTTDHSRRDADYTRDETALLFVDMQRIYCIPGRDPGHPERDASHYYHRRLRDTVIPNQVRLLKAARRAKSRWSTRSSRR